MRMRVARIRIIAAAIVASLLPLAGCGGESLTSTTTSIITALVDGRADSLLAAASDNWFAPTGFSINPAHGPDLTGPRVFCGSAGGAIYAFHEGDEILRVGYIASDGTMYPPVRILGDYTSMDLSSLLVVFNQVGDAAITFIAEQDRDRSTAGTSEPDQASDRVYYTYFLADLADTADNGEGMEHGFRVTPEAIDSNVPWQDDDSEVGPLFVASNLLEGSHLFEESGTNSIDETCSGSHGLSGLTWFIFFGWYGEEQDASGTDPTRPFLEGRFVNLDTASDDYMQVTAAPIELDTDPVIDPDEGDGIGRSEIITSGRDIVFRVIDVDNGEGVSQESLNLVRINDAGNAPGTPSAIRRGTSLTATTVVSAEMQVVGGGFTPFNGQTGTWIWYPESGYTDGGVANGDTDLLIARVDDDGTAEVDEFDHESPESTSSNSIDLFGSDVARGATSAMIWFRQLDDPDGAAPSISLFAVGVVFTDGSAGFHRNAVSDALLVSEEPDDTNGDTDVLTGKIPGRHNPDCAADSNPLAFGMAFVREQNDAVLYDHYVSVVSLDALDPNPSTPPTLTATTELMASSDTDWGLVTPQSIIDSGNGGFLVLLRLNGNNLEDDSAADAFDESRTYAYATGLAGDQTLALTEVCSGSLEDELSLPDMRITYDTWAVTTIEGDSSPERDFEFDFDVQEPDLCHIFVNEATTFTELTATTLRDRVLDLRENDAEAAEDRFTPALGEAPLDVSVGNEETELIDMTDEDNAMVVLFREGVGDADWLPRVNTFSADSFTWNDPAVFTNELIDVDLYLQDHLLLLIPGWRADTCCHRITGGWLFWERVMFDDESGLQARRFTSTALADTEH